MKVQKIKQDIQSKGSNHYNVKFKGKLTLKPGDMFIYSSTKDDMESAFEVLEIKSDREIKVRKLTPAIYVWTTEAYQKSNIYKIGLVNWQSVERRLKQTDATGMLQPIILIEKFDLLVLDPKTTDAIESKIHKTLELMVDPITGKSHRERLDRESFNGDYQTILRPVIVDTIKDFKATVKTTSLYPTQRHYQYAAEQRALKHYLTNDRGWIHWTCGTGKSYGLPWLMLAMFSHIKNCKNTALIYVPSKHLVDQTGNDVEFVLNSMGKKVRLAKVYSETGGKDAGDITALLNTASDDTITVIISTYQSNDTVRMGLSASNLKSFDVLVGDEIHKTSGEDGKLFQRAIRETIATKRLYMTASPVKYIENDYNYSGQENEFLYGQCFHSYGFLEAIFDKYIAPVHIYGLTADKDQLEELKALIDYKKRVIPGESDWDINHSNFTYISMLYTTLTAIQQGIITHPIIYTNKVARGERFMEDLIKLSNKFGGILNHSNVKVLSGSDKVSDRIEYIDNNFSKANVSVLINSRCLQEGISVSKADAVIIIDPRHSAADLIQILGRPVRLDLENPEKIAKIFIPMVIEKNNEGKTIFNETCFGATRDWLTAITSSDADFATYFGEQSVFKVNFNEETRKGISYRNVKDPNAPVVPSPKNGSNAPIDEEAAYEFPKELFESLSLKIFKKVTSNKVKREMNVKEVVEGNLCREINDYVMSELRTAHTYIDKFNTRNFKKYAAFYITDVNVMIENLISQTGANKSDLEDCIKTYSGKIEELNILKSNLKNKVKKSLILSL